MVNRRALLRLAGTTLAGGSAAGLAACSTKAPRLPPTRSPARPSALRHDVATLNALLDLEHRAIAAYTAGIPLLSGPARSAARLFLSHEFGHAAELTDLIHRGGGKARPAAPTYDLGQPQRERDVVRLLHSIEAETIGAYLAALPKLAPGGVRSTVSSILSCEAEHVSILRGELGESAVPSAFVTAAE